ncbi:MAG: copper resistance CopC family protein [Actinomycetota bacterium]
MVAILATAAPASAHDQLISSTPSDGEQLDAPPEDITLTFSGQLLILDESMSGAVVLVVDESGRDWATGEVELRGDTVIAELDPAMPEAGYQVRWQVVSEDGHPISGVVPFTVGDAAPVEATAVPEEAPDETPEGTEEADEQTADDGGGVLRPLLVGAGGAVLAVAAFALYRFLRRPRATVAPPESGESATDEL